MHEIHYSKCICSRRLEEQSFCFAAKEVFSILIENTAQIGIAVSINDYLMLLGKLVIDLGCVMFAYGWLSLDPSYSKNPGSFTSVTYSFLCLW